MTTEGDILAPSPAPAAPAVPAQWGAPGGAMGGALVPAPTDPAATGVPTRFLSARFRSFHVLLRDIAGEARALGDAPPHSRVEALVGALVNHLSAGREEAQRLGGAYGATLYQDACYVMAALADEVFLFQLDWGGRDAWDDILVEARACGSRLAGERVFERIDTLLAASEPAHAELAGLYLMALALGFQGRYRDVPGGAEVLASYRRRLRALAGGATPPLHPGDGGGPLFPDAYAQTLDEGTPVGLPPLRRWLWLAAGLAAGYLLLSHVAWRLVTADVRAIVSALPGGG
ncbi:DotU family type IV/VI secretion system protein [Novispirillum sp. DQ9]|uniref:DotU family type IV/VI secretion system protein n=1 Tax=Novispirillum sp. DQ9 TaxID=3398612 RepID=UPI003C7D129E